MFIIGSLLCLWEQGTPGQFSKQISKLSFQLSFQIYSFLAQTEGERKAFFGRVQEGGTTLQDYPQEHLVEKKSLLLNLKCYPSFVFIRPLTNKHCSTWSSMINLWIDSRTCQKYRILLSARSRFNNNNYLELSKKNSYINS